MENSLFHKISLSLFLLLLNFSFTPFYSFASEYGFPEKYFIDCGSSSTPRVAGQNFNFIGDENPNNFKVSSAGKMRSVDNSSSSSQEIYQTARVFKKKSMYELQIHKNGTYMVRFHFFPFSSPENLFDARFNVSASGFYLLSNFSVEKSSISNFPEIKEFLLTVNVTGKFQIYFLPLESSLAFVNAIEFFLTPDNFINNSDAHVSHTTNYDILFSKPLHVVHRINVGGSNIKSEQDNLLRRWINDDSYLLNKNSAMNSTLYSESPVGSATQYDAPDLVYQTAKQTTSNISWSFPVSKRAEYFVRFHFCDIVTQHSNEGIQFSLSVSGNFSTVISPYNRTSTLAVPFLVDVVVDSDDSGFMNIGIGHRSDSREDIAFLNGVEIMKLIEDRGSVDLDEGSTKTRLFIIIGLCIGGLMLIFAILGVLLVVLRRKKLKRNESFDLPVGDLYEVTSYSKTSGRTSTINGSPLADLNLHLRVPLKDIVYATNNFDRKFLIGEGGFGKVYKGTLRNGTKVAIKRRETGSGQGLPEFETEVMLLSKIRHRHLVSLIGYCQERSEMILVYEFMEKGTLREHLYTSELMEKGTSRDHHYASELSWNQRLEICIGAARGIHYLHTESNRAIIHRDIKSTNILLDEHCVAKVADFGLSRSGPLDLTHVSTVVKGSFGYLDPEYFKCFQLTQKSDVYSFGVVLLEVFCARPAVDNLLPREEVNLAEWGLSWQKKGKLEEIVDPFLVGKINPASLRKFGETVERCLQEWGADRPNMKEVLWDLEYALGLQRNATPRVLQGDTNSSVNFVEQLPSQSFAVSKDEASHVPYSLPDSSGASDSEVFSLLNIDEAR